MQVKAFLFREKLRACCPVPGKWFSFELGEMKVELKLCWLWTVYVNGEMRKRGVRAHSTVWPHLCTGTEAGTRIRYLVPRQATKFLSSRHDCSTRGKRDEAQWLEIIDLL